VGGLSAAAAALRHFDLVTVFEKDDILGSRVANETPFEVGAVRAGRLQLK
jgi:phytoene dehydrogenase-like protein